MLIKGSLLIGSSTPFFGTLLAQAAGSDVQWLSYLLNGGPFAIVVFLLVTDKLTTPGERDRLREELSASHDREAALNENIRTEFVPLMTRNLEAVTRSTELTEKTFAILSDEDRFPKSKG